MKDMPVVLSLLTLILTLCFFSIFGITNSSAATTADNFSVNVTIGNSAPSIDKLFAIAATDPTQASSKSVPVIFQASDMDGMGDINNATAVATFVGGTNGNSNGRYNSTCRATTINTTSINYTCNVIVWYWDAPGTWTVNVSVNDSTGAIGYLQSTFTINTLTGMSMTPDNLTFGSIAAGAVSGAGNDPVNVSNEGNTNISTIKMNATDLLTAGDILLASAFSMNENDSITGATALSNWTDVTLGWANVTCGNGTKENMYTYVTVPAGKTKATYNAPRNWVVTIS